MLITLQLFAQLFFELRRNELERHAPRKKKYLRGNNKPFMTIHYGKDAFKKHLFEKSNCCK